MKAIACSLIVFAAVLSLGSSCGTAEKNDPPVDFKFVLTDSLGRESVVFKEGENITFNFTVISKSGRPGAILGFDRTDFFRVFRTGAVGESGKFVSLGKPYEGEPCLYRLGGDHLAANGTSTYTIAWMPVARQYSDLFCRPMFDNKPLPRGRYRTAFRTPFTLLFNGEQYVTDTFDFSIDFEVQ